MYTITLNIIISIVLFITGIMNIFGKGIPDNAKKKLDKKSLMKWIRIRGVGCLLASPGFSLIAYSQVRVVSKYLVYFIFISITIACIIVFGSNKKYLNNIFGK